CARSASAPRRWARAPRPANSCRRTGASSFASPHVSLCASRGRTRCDFSCWRLSPELLHDVAQLRENQLRHCETNGIRRARQDEDRLALCAAGCGAAHHRGGTNLLIAEHAEQLAEAGESFLEQPI